MTEGSILWVRSLLAVYRQASLDACQESAPPEARRRLLEEVARLHGVFAAHEDITTLWREGFGGSEARARAVLAPVVEAALLCYPESPMRALAEFAAEEIAALFEEGAT